MNVFVDTSAVLALRNPQDRSYQTAVQVWQRLLDDEQPLWTTNYVVLETIALLQARSGMQAVHVFQSSILPFLQTIWIDAEMHEMSTRSLLLANRRNLSLVDCSSMAVARRYDIQHFFAFDHHFDEQGFVCLTF
jgi:predicted nucleic acid-binding protein